MDYPTQLAEENPLQPNPSVLYLQSTAIDSLLAGTVNTSMEAVYVAVFPYPFFVPSQPNHTRLSKALLLSGSRRPRVAIGLLPRLHLPVLDGLIPLR